MQISKYLRITWTLLKELYNFSLNLLKAIIKKLANIFREIFNLFMSFFRNLSLGYYNVLKKTLTVGLKFGMLGELVATLLILLFMTSPPFVYYFFYNERWFLIMSVISSMILVMVGYKHLRRIRR